MTSALCSIDGCAKPARSKTAQLCEMHYARVRNHGDPHVTKRRVPNGSCHRCGKPTKETSRGLFCSRMCARRDRLGVAVGQLSCVVCGSSIDENRRLDAQLCSISCRNMRDRANRYGCSPAALHQALEQHAGCHVCGSLEGVHIDHDHETGTIRGVLCSTCNTGIGMLKDSPDLLRAAAAYLEERGTNEWMARINSEESAAA